jgi:inosine-uridine nucleoside N-ribohydrolase
MEKIGYQKNLIIDTDMGWDDVIAILLLMKNPNIRICGITVTGCGETHLDDGVAIAQGLLALANIKAPVCRGATSPSMYNHQFPDSFRETMDSACGLRKNLPDPLQPVDPRMAWEFMRDTLEREEYQVSILSLGGLTNIARMMGMNPEPEISNIERICIMGGAIYVDGNIAALNNSEPEWDQGTEYASNFYAEWNIFLDPPAAKKVFDSEIPTTLVPLDACDYVLLGPEYIDMVVADDPVASFLRDILKAKSVGPAKESIPLPVFDPLAAMIMTGALRPGHSERLGIDVVAEGQEMAFRGEHLKFHNLVVDVEILVVGPWQSRVQMDDHLVGDLLGAILHLPQKRMGDSYRLEVSTDAIVFGVGRAQLPAHLHGEPFCLRTIAIGTVIKEVRTG